MELALRHVCPNAEIQTGPQQAWFRKCDDMDEPVADETRSILDGHVVLARILADRGHFPAIDVNRSVSRLVAPRHAAAQQLREVLAVYEENRVLMTYAGRQPGNAKLDAAVSKIDAVEALLRQPPKEATPAAETVARLQRIFPSWRWQDSP